MTKLPFEPRKPILLGSFVLVAIVTVAVFVPTLSAHISVMNAVSIDATPTEYAVSDDGETLVVTVRVDNPTRSAFTASYGQLYAEIDGEEVTELSTVEETTVSSGGSVRVTVDLDIEDGYGDRVADAVESGRLTVYGTLDGTIQDAQVRVEVVEGDDG